MGGTRPGRLIAVRATIAGDMDLTAVVPFLIGIAVAWLALLIVLWLHRPTREQVGPLVRLAPDLARLAKGVLGDPATPRSPATKWESSR